MIDCLLLVWIGLVKPRIEDHFESCSEGYFDLGELPLIGVEGNSVQVIVVPTNNSILVW